MTIHERFEKYEDEFLKFERVEGRRSERADLHAFIVLDELLPGKKDIVGGAYHEEIYLNIELEELDKVATDDHILELVRCGIRVSPEYDCLAMFV